MVDWEEWRADLKLRGVPDAEIEAVFAKYDLDGDMVLNNEERRKLKEDLLRQTNQLNAEIEVDYKFQYKSCKLIYFIRM